MGCVIDSEILVCTAFCESVSFRHSAQLTAQGCPQGTADFAYAKELLLRELASSGGGPLRAPVGDGFDDQHVPGGVDSVGDRPIDDAPRTRAVR